MNTIRYRWYELQEAIKKAMEEGETVISEVGRQLPRGLEDRLRKAGYQVEAGIRLKSFTDLIDPKEYYYVIRWKPTGDKNAYANAAMFR